MNNMSTDHTEEEHFSATSLKNSINFILII